MSLSADGLLQLRPEGLHCPAAGVWIDPWRPVAEALITHAHADHARPGSGRYWAIGSAEGILRRRLGAGIDLQNLSYGQTIARGGVRFSFHSAGHVLGSAQILVEGGGERWLVSGDFKRQGDPSCAPFTPVRADVLISEATFGLPIYHWREPAAVVQELVAWWREAPERPSVVFCYAFGKAQRLLAELHAAGVEEEVLLHGAVQALMAPYREAGVPMPPTRPLAELPRDTPLAGRLVLAPPAAQGSSWMRRLRGAQCGLASGWMAVRGARRRRAGCRGFVLSDHADWHALVQTAQESGARQVLLNHGQGEHLARYLREEVGIASEVIGAAQRDEPVADLTADGLSAADSSEQRLAVAAGKDATPTQQRQGAASVTQKGGSEAGFSALLP
ncbi:MAG: ligase-associated DNA damage response exonuclease [Cyanobium sp.]